MTTDAQYDDLRATLGEAIAFERAASELGKYFEGPLENRNDSQWLLERNRLPGLADTADEDTYEELLETMGYEALHVAPLGDIGRYQEAAQELDYTPDNIAEQATGFFYLVEHRAMELAKDVAARAAETDEYDIWEQRFNNLATDEQSERAVFGERLEDQHDWLEKYDIEAVTPGTVSQVLGISMPERRTERP